MDDKNKKIIVASTVVVAIILILITVATGTYAYKTDDPVPKVKEPEKMGLSIKNWTNNTQKTMTIDGETVDNEAKYIDVKKIEKLIVVKGNMINLDGVDVTLNKVGDYAKYKFQIVNESEKAMRQVDFSYGFGCQGQTECQVGLILANVTCRNTQDVEDESNFSGLLKKGDTAYCELLIRYKEPEEDEVASGPQSIRFGAHWEWKEETSK